MKVANFMDSSLVELDKKGNLTASPEIYNPNNAYSKVVHFTPHYQDLKYTAYFKQFSIQLYSYGVDTLWTSRVVVGFFKIFKQFSKNKFDIVRGRLPYLGSLYGLLMAKIFRIPFVLSLGGDNRLCQEKNKKFNYNSKFISYTMEKFVLRYSDRIICPNLFTKKYVERLIGKKQSEKRCTVIPWISEAIPEKEEKGFICERFNIPSDAVLILIIGFLNRYKYTDVLYNVIKKWKSPLPDKKIVFAFCGDGPLYQKGVQEFLDNESVYFWGWQEREIVHQLIRRAYLLLIPMSGFVLLEAASLGKPVITSKVEWHAEMIEDHVTGLLVDPLSVEEWVNQINFALLNPQKMTTYAKCLEKKYWSKYSGLIAKQLEIDLYRSLYQNRKK
ncbi:glycosyltransferase family 4 protein [Coxiella burnetii]|uniref:Glycosyltransferase n=1 Tax=Coxiella burnetii (strain RSA 493 / Nine Mile phase I) TaxID=227377 RepID=Q83D95_COXBU|nr:glycosyltransferase family 4 protein [Coxiella burnetii]NP_819863.2 glycosyltransferase [Coxiella burnetii RSA 493]AAO90377.2 glycosyltransferase [Coxiella burnetii RSA 493]ARI65676.1 glycosyl transferase [Coxiella burnetii]ARK27152.1 glycosyl transferase [Coxiella burnetii]MCF2092938.1 glycosyltransferase family 4 protein [Coxiella burnetii]MCF2094868.1 glycosyltransferase family 4 protein [Coxiella burnetii]